MLKDFINNVVQDIVGSAATFLTVASFCLFAFGVVKFIYGRYSDKSSLGDIKKAKDFMLWGIISLFIILSAWGIIGIVQGFLGTGNNEFNFDEIKILK